MLQIIVIAIWYSEKVNQSKTEEALDSASTLNKIAHFTNKINRSFINSQKNFNDYKVQNDKKSLEKYIASLNGLNNLIDSLNLISNNNEEFAKILIERNKSQVNIQVLKANIDSIIDLQINPDKNKISKLFVLDKFEYKKILDSIKTESYVKTDSVTKKGLFARLGNALAGKSEVQKEQVNTTITMKYNNKIVTGSIEEQMANIFNTTYDYYGQQFKNLKNNFANLRNQDARLMELNNRLLTIEGKLLPTYSDSISILQDNNQKQLQDSSDSNKIVRSYTIAILIVIMLVLSILIFSFTTISFQYETRLTAAHLKIKENLSFKNRIVGMISHEIRSPLSIISMYSKMISSSIKDQEIQESFKSIQFTTNSLLLLTNQILEYSKDENRTLKLNKTTFKLVDEIDQIIVSISSLVESKGNKIEVESNLLSNYEISSDLIKIHQLFYNLIGNANKFTKNGLISIAVDFELIEDKKLNLKVGIKDNGIGISESDLKNVFQSYYQGTVSENVKDLGVGLGLNLCKEIVELFDGEINIESQIGIGTKVIFNLILNVV
ncbi:HAMP domain-containing histidine kinase [Flavobacterium sp. TR2]|uniref:sensor histidine kinase n=1 Tax=Flavobacterium sp. TR2 TaxID=2977321 RepID=UPI0021B10930|nr:HAMP domain-containing sensor histidine kinase [Flavobacterium sp. TR2]UWY27725.1 HAMP domain-containing histidine kinase [Flavobacterium sp. TR2]